MERSGIRRQRRGWIGWSLNNGLRLWLWYLILTVAFRCPNSPSEVTPDSPTACRYYFDAKDRLLPVVQPYYSAYAAPYVEALRPYHDAVYGNVLLPSYVFVTSNYRKYAASHVEQVYVVGQGTWDRTVKPQIDTATAQLVDTYDRSLGPYVGQAYQAAKPHIDTVQEIGRTQYYAVVIPTYESVQPYAKIAYDQGYKATTEVALPYGLWAGETVVTFVQRRIWPPIRILYGENIQPQLAKIQERLSSYKDGKRLESVVESVDATRSSSSVSSSSSLASSISASVSYEASPSSSSKTSASKSKATTQQAAEIEDYAGELRAWQEKFSKAADRGAADLRDRIADITNRQVEEQAKGTGGALLNSLDDVTMQVLEQLKPDVLNIIKSLDSGEEAPAEEAVEAAKESTRVAVRAAGKRIKDSAQRLRAWRKKYNEDLEALVNAATNSTLEVVDNIRDLGLQEIGMRWATLDGVSYKDWSEYHDMRKSFADWRSTVQDVVDKHQGPKVANAAGEDVESRGMVIAENAAKELARLKDVALWKVEALDSGDDFSTRYSPPGAARAAQKAKQKVLSASSEYLGSSSSASGIESVVSEASSFAEPAAEKITSVVGDASAKASSAANVAAGSVAEAASSASSAVSAAAEYAASDASKTSSSASKQASASAKPKSRSSISSEAASEASSSTSKASKSASSAASSISSKISSDVSSASDAASSSISSVSDSASSKLRSKSKSKSKTGQNSAQEMASSIQARLRSERAAASADDPAAIKAQESLRKRMEALRDSSNEKAAKIVSLAPGASKFVSSAAGAASDAVSQKASSASFAAESAQSSHVRDRSTSSAKSRAASVASDASSAASAAGDTLASEASEASSKLEL